MMSLLRDLRHGRDLRHLPVALDLETPSAVHAIAEDRSGVMQSVMHVPVSLSPFIIGLAGDGVRLDDVGTLYLADVEQVGSDPGSTGRGARVQIHAIELLETAGLRLQLVKPQGASNLFERASVRYWKYALAWRKAVRDRGAPGRLSMSPLDLRALDCYYVWPRPVYLVGVQDGGNSNLFPMDLVGPMGGEFFCLALRSTSPSVKTMINSERAALSLTPASWKDIAYKLGTHHRRLSIDIDSLPFALRRSREFGLPVADNALGYLELKLLEARPIGSHTFFVGRIAYQERFQPGHQLGHVSALYAAWRRRNGRPFEEV